MWLGLVSVLGYIPYVRIYCKTEDPYDRVYIHRIEVGTGATYA